jgi:hypothetical protein
MARTELAVQQPDPAGLTVTLEAVNAVDGNMIPWRAGRTLHVKNDDAASKTVTVLVPTTVDGLAITDRIVNVPAGVEKEIPIGEQYYRQPTDGMVYIDWSAGTQVTARAVDR